MEKELAEVVEENGIVYRLAEDGCYYPDLRLPEGTQYHIGKYGLMRWEYLTANNRREYFRLLVFGELNGYLHEMDVECYDMVEWITEELKATDPLEWIGLINNVKNAAEEIVLREMIYA